MEIRNPTYPYLLHGGRVGLEECAFKASHFRPVTDISSLEALLKAQPAPGLLDEELKQIVRENVQRQKEGV
jgi:hypothetical protein